MSTGFIVASCFGCVSITVLMFTLKSPCRKNLRYLDISPSRLSVSPSLSLAALQALKRKKRYEKQLDQIDGTLSTIEFQREALENANTNTEVLKNMGFASEALKAAHQHM